MNYPKFLEMKRFAMFIAAAAMAVSASAQQRTTVTANNADDNVYVGINAGATSICVLTGEATPYEIEASEQKPDYCFDSIKELYEALL